MTTKKEEPQKAAEKKEEVKQKTCFAIMPIADHPDYHAGHFTRVYNHIIKPACEKAGYKVIRADDAKASHMIMFDILKNIVDCDMAICDLSSKNANVFYELGLRQAFNKKTILITDDLTSTPFDITGFRYVKYSSSLRVDTVSSEINEISSMLTETENANESDINSIVNLLRIQPAVINKIELNENDSVLYQMIKKLDAKVSYLTNNDKNNAHLKNNNYFLSTALGLYSGTSFDEIEENSPQSLKNISFKDGRKRIGKFVGYNEEQDLVFFDGTTLSVIMNNDFDRSTIIAM